MLPTVKKIGLFWLTNKMNPAQEHVLSEMFKQKIYSQSNTESEWTHAKIGTKQSGNNIVGSSHQKSSTAVGAYLRKKGYTLREVNHNHPSGKAITSEGDRDGAHEYHSKNINTILQIYTHPNNYVKYDEQGIIIDPSKLNLPDIIVTP